jgi:hypothetical protein
MGGYCIKKPSEYPCQSRQFQVQVDSESGSMPDYHYLMPVGIG